MREPSITEKAIVSFLVEYELPVASQAGIDLSMSV